jgi:putative ATPase
MSLFEDAPLSHANVDEVAEGAPLAERLRPRTLDGFIGQKHIIGPGMPLRRQIERDELTSMIFWGPPGVGKTTLARLIARLTKCDFIPFSAVLGGVKEIKTAMAEAERNRKAGRRTVLFVDEIHRFNKSQQDAFLPYVEKGDIVLIGATTENPSFEVNAALLSRCRVYRLEALEDEEIATLLRRAAEALGIGIEDALLLRMASFANGDARSAYNLLEISRAVADNNQITDEVLAAVLQRRNLPYDKSGEEHFNLISALHKSVRSSDADAALYWLARMLEGGEDRLYLARRLMRMAIEDIGLADPRALEQAVAAMQCVHFLGVPEGDQALAQLTLYLAVAPKSDAAYRAFGAATKEVSSGRSYPVPLHLRNAPTRAMKEWGYGKGYEHAHQNEEAITKMACFPTQLVGTIYYEPTQRGVEARIRERLEQLRAARSEIRDHDEQV